MAITSFRVAECKHISRDMPIGANCRVDSNRAVGEAHGGFPTRLCSSVSSCRISSVSNTIDRCVYTSSVARQSMSMVYLVQYISLTKFM